MFWNIAAGAITGANVFMFLAIVISERKRKERIKAIVARLEATEDRRKLREYQKNRMCEQYCKYRESAESQEQLDLKCWDCPVGEL